MSSRTGNFPLFGPRALGPQSTTLLVASSNLRVWRQIKSRKILFPTFPRFPFALCAKMFPAWPPPGIQLKSSQLPPAWSAASPAPEGFVPGLKQISGGLQRSELPFLLHPSLPLQEDDPARAWPRSIPKLKFFNIKTIHSKTRLFKIS